MGAYLTKAQVDPDLINAGKQTISQVPDSSYFDSATSFAMIRGGHVDLAILGALQVSMKGDLANWMVPGKMVKGMGGAMDPVAGVKRVIVIMEHNAKDGASKLVKECTLPLTGRQVVHLVITELGVFSIEASGVTLIELAPGVTREEVKAKTLSLILKSKMNTYFLQSLRVRYP
ncbi:MAG: CoA-transferase [Methanothrix soehngenii]